MMIVKRGQLGDVEDAIKAQRDKADKFFSLKYE
jgi:hypothetical protein